MKRKKNKERQGLFKITVYVEENILNGNFNTIKHESLMCREDSLGPNFDEIVERVDKYIKPIRERYGNE